LEILLLLAQRTFCFTKHCRSG